MDNITDNYITEEVEDNEELSELESHLLADSDVKHGKKYHIDSDLIKNISALISYLSDDKVKWYRKTLVAATILYFTRPKDKLENWNDFFDFLDDIGAVEAAVRFLGKEIEKYY